MTENFIKSNNYIYWIVTALLIILIGVGGYFYYGTFKELGLTKIELANTKADLTQSEQKAQDLNNSLETEVYKNSLFSGQISQITDTVGKLDKLSKTDKELLQKYSKVYFLSENYVPESLSDIDSQFIYEKSKQIQIHTKVLPFLNDMIKAAGNAGINLKIISGYRSFNEQSSLKGSYTVTYGSGANKFSADQGYSEHQLGTALDFTTDELGADFSDFDSSKAYKWFMDNAYKYGFIISYPKGNTYYQYEPWHWRFVGRQLAERLHQDNQNFYDLDQRQIDAYLINIFD